MREGSRDGLPPGFGEGRRKERDTVERAVHRPKRPRAVAPRHDGRGCAFPAPPPRRRSPSGSGRGLPCNPAADALAMAPGAADETGRITHDRLGDPGVDDLAVLRTHPSPRGGDVARPGGPNGRECGGKAGRDREDDASVVVLAGDGARLTGIDDSSKPPPARRHSHSISASSGSKPPKESDAHARPGPVLRARPADVSSGATKSSR
ncbi:hypothetical protein [Streptomyces roseolus]|uniref:hypothetical protein n=1 Tax=Streptomyces roseolus TaxID=67358 RepID=UPI00167A71D1|nr:hypothetical protein [Streptomyces roseolus]GGR35954.1 hypothetical protein GCM10010282_30460 [Streptomyces roseolus]